MRIHGNQIPDRNSVCCRWFASELVIIDKHTHEIVYTEAYYYLAHFSKLVRPGAVRVETEGRAAGLRVMGLLTPQGGHVAELLNSRAENATVRVESQGKTLQLTLAAGSITTAIW